MSGVTFEIEGRTVGVLDPAEMAGLSGLEFMQNMASGKYPRAPIGGLLGFDGAEAERGRVVFTGTPSEKHYNPLGTVHGGYAATLLDSAMGCAVHTMLPAGRGYTTLELKVNYVRAMTRDTGPIRCEGTIIHAGGKVATAEGRITDAAGTLYAHGSTTCLIFPLGRG